jgi:hypothetical protein
MFCALQKSSISAVSGMPPMGEAAASEDKADDRDGVGDEVEAAGVLLHLVGVAGNDDRGAEPERVFLLVG